MARDYTKYDVTDVAERLNKRALVLAVVQDYIEKHNPTFDELMTAFPSDLQGNKGVFQKMSDVKDHKRFHITQPLKLKHGVQVVVCNQWGDNIDGFIERARSLGYSITPQKPSVDSKQDSASTLDFDNFDVVKMSKYFKSIEENDELMEKVDAELETLLDKDPKYYLPALLFQPYGFFYDKPDYYVIHEDAHELIDLLKEKSLLEIVVERENLENIKLSDDNGDFILKFGAYFVVALETLIERDDKELIAEFIVNQSIGTIEDICDVEADGGDWISDVTLEIIEHILGYDIFDYEGDCEIDGYYFGQAQSMGYDYHAYSQDIIDSMI
ncbi:MAG: hypothetical protein ACON5K_11560 [Bacteroidia bacterium]